MTSWTASALRTDHWARYPVAIKAAAKIFEGPPENDPERVEWYGRQLTLNLEGLEWCPGN